MFLHFKTSTGFLNPTSGSKAALVERAERDMSNPGKIQAEENDPFSAGFSLPYPREQRFTKKQTQV